MYINIYKYVLPEKTDETSIKEAFFKKFKILINSIKEKKTELKITELIPPL